MAPDGVIDLSGVDPTAVPRALAVEHGRLAPGDVVAASLPALPHPDDVIAGAGFAATSDGRLERLRTLPDTVGPDLGVLLVGLNPSLHAADAGYGYAGPGNRFWPAAVAAGLVPVPHDTLAALDAGVGMTDLVKRATPRAAELRPEEYRAGLARLGRLCRWLRPAVICFVGITGYRAARDRRAGTGWQDEPIGPARVYVMPNPSGLNAHATPADFVAHFGTVAAAAGLGKHRG